MNILQILPRLDIGGVETGTIDLSMELNKRGHKVIVVSGGGRLVRNLIELNIRHIELPVHKRSPFAIISCIKKLESIIRDEHVDIVHSRSRVPNIIAFFACRHTAARFITTAHGYYSTHFISRITGWARYVIVASSVIGRHMIQDFGVPYERVRFIPRGVDLDRFRFNMPALSTKPEYKIGVIGRITPIKGHAVFLQAIARVVRLFPKARVVIVGEAPGDKPEYLEKLKALTRQLDIERFVEFLAARYDIPKIMADLDLLVLPSVGREAFGRVIIEAGASGVPVIATAVGGATEIVEDGRTGILVRPGDIIEMVNSIIKVLKDRELSKDLALEARKKVEKEYSLAKMADDTLRVYEEAHKRKNILVIKLGAIGDVILIVPSLRLLRNNLPDARIEVLVGSGSKNVLKPCPYIDGLIIYDRKEKDRGMRGLLKLCAVIRRKNFDISIDFQNNKASHGIAWLGSIPERFGYKNGRFSFFLNKVIRYLKIRATASCHKFLQETLGTVPSDPYYQESKSRGTTPLSEQFRILKGMGIDIGGASTYLEMWPSKEDFLYVENFLRHEWVNDSQVLVGINIGSSPRWETKRWPLKNFVKIADMLASKDIRMVLIGSKDASNQAQEFLKISASKPVNAAGKTTIGQLAALIKRCKIFITGDSAPMHIASSMGTDFIALFGPTDPARHLEPTKKGRVIRKDLKCSPCYKPKCRKNICMEDISVDEVYRLVMEKINSNKS